jgi:selenocysteine lyase/cysteine desulfurase
VADAAHAAGAKVFVDAVALVPHRRVDVAELGADVLVSSAYKWYGPHAGAMWVDPELLESLHAYKVRPASDTGPNRFETGTASYEALAALDAAARFVLDVGIDSLRAHEERTFAPLLSGLQSIAGVRCFGRPGLDGRTPTVSFTVDGVHPDDVARQLAAARVAVWSGHSYAVEVADALGVSDSGGLVRAGVVAYIDDDDVQRLLDAVDRIARGVGAR